MSTLNFSNAISLFARNLGMELGNDAIQHQTGLSRVVLREVHGFPKRLELLVEGLGPDARAIAHVLMANLACRVVVTRHGTP